MRDDKLEMQACPCRFRRSSAIRHLRFVVCHLEYLTLLASSLNPLQQRGCDIQVSPNPGADGNTRQSAFAEALVSRFPEPRNLYERRIVQIDRSRIESQLAGDRREIPCARLLYDGERQRDGS